MSKTEDLLSVLYDPLSPEQLADPYPVYKLARENEPIFQSRKVLRHTGVWVITRYDDILEVEANSELFLSKDTLEPLVPIYPETREVLSKGYPLEVTVVEADGPNHRRISAPLKRIFSPHTAALQEKFISATIDQLIDTMTAEGRRQADIISEFAYQLPLKVINNLFGVPESEQEQVKLWCDDWMRFISADLSPESQARAAQGMENFFHYLANLVAERRRHPRENDLVTLFAQHHEPGFEPLSDSELVNNLGTILLAGHVPVTNLIGNGLHVLLDQRRHWETIIARPDRIPHVIEEILRYRTPTKAFFRTAARDTVLNGTKIAEGEMLQLLYGSANHDESKWENPEVFDPSLDRRGTRLMSFGYGPHYCLGIPLARAEGRIALERLTRRLPGMRLVEQEFRYLEMVIQHGFQELLVEW